MPDHYIECGDDGCDCKHFAVVRDEDGQIDRFECAKCGSASFQRGPPAPEGRHA